MKTSIKLLLTILLLTCFRHEQVLAERGDKTKSIHTPEGGSPVVVGTVTAKDSIELDALASNQRDYQVKNRISFGVDMHYPEFVSGPQLVEVSMLVKRYDVNNAPLPDLTFKLNIAYYHHDTIHSKILHNYEFDNAYRMVFRIDTIRVNGTITNTLPKNLFVQGDIFVERYTTLTLDEMTPAHEFLDVDCNDLSDGVKFKWLAVSGAEEYQVEFLHISNYGAHNTILSDLALNYNFRHNSTRITTSALFYDIALLFDRGWIAYRVRAVGVDIDNPNHLIFGEWSAPVSGTIGDLSAGKLEITDAEVHEKTLNWQYSATYAEQGKRKEVITYYDGTLRNRQAVTKINSDNNVIVGETFYDHQGRPTVTALPIPVEHPECEEDPQPVIKYYPNFNRNSQDQPYSKIDFDLSPEDECVLSAGPMSTSSGASRYYSSENPNQELHQAYVPKAYGYPFQQVEYTPDNTGRINRQSGVGPEFQLGSGKEVKYLYGNPNQLELNRIFGSEVGYYQHYQKNAVIDANGQVSISYLDMAGKVIATALAGAAPENMLTLEAPMADTLEVHHIFPDGSNQEIDLLTNTVTLSTSFIVTAPTQAFIDYGIVSIPMVDTCLNDICVDCIYELELSLKDDCGMNLLSDTLQNKIIGNFQLDTLGNYVFHEQCDTNYNFRSQTEVYLNIGKYTLAKRLTIKNEALHSYLDLIDSSSCVLTYKDFLNAELANVDSTICIVDCDNCLEQLGTLQAFISNGHGTSGEYYARVQECSELCETRKTDCEMYYTMMQIDMSPGGQYGEYLNNTTGAINLSIPLSIYNSSNLLPSTATWRTPKLITPNGNQPIYVDEAGQRSRIYLSPNPDNSGNFTPVPLSNNLVQFDSVTNQSFIYPEQLLFVVDFIDNFEQSWALSLVSYHPEYCYYESCIMYDEKHAETDAFSSSSFDLLLLNTNTFLEAQARGLISPSGTPTNWFSPTGNNPLDSLKPWDPFVFYSADFEQTICADYSDKLVQKYNHFEYISGQWFSMPEVAAYTARCGLSFPANPPVDCYNFGQLYNGIIDTTVLNQEWRLLKAMYMSTKQEFQQNLADCKAIYHCSSFNECIGDDQYFPFAAFFSLLASVWNYHPLWSPVQPCSLSKFHLYRYKTKRFSNHKDAAKEDANSTAYEMYLQTGQCPNAFSLQQLLNEITQENQLTATTFDLNTFGYLSALFQANNSYSNPGPLPSLEHTSTVSANSIVANWTDVANSSVLATLTLDKTASQSWSEVTGIINLFATSSNSFTAEGIYNDVSDTITPVKVFTITGTISYFDLTGCAFKQECTSNQLAIDLSTAFNILNLDGNLPPITPVNISSYTSTTLGSTVNLSSLYIQNAANVGSNLMMVFDVPSNSYHVYSGTNPSANGLYVKVLSSAVPNSPITFIDPMVSSGNYSFELNVNQNVGYPIEMSGIMYQVNGNDTIGISAGDCSLPVPNKCEDIVYEVYEDLQLLLNDVLVNYTGTSSINLYSNIHMTPAIVSVLPYGQVATTSNDDGDSLIISAGDCDLTLSMDTSHYVQFDNLIGMDNFTLVGDLNLQSAYSNFTFTGEFETPTGSLFATVNGSTCFSLKECNPCSDTAIVTMGLQRFAEPFNEGLNLRLKNAATNSNCSDYYSEYRACEEAFYSQYGYYALNLDSISFLELSFCECMETFCDYINETNIASNIASHFQLATVCQTTISTSGTIPGGVTYDTITICKTYVTTQFDCDYIQIEPDTVCTTAYSNYAFCVTNFNTNNTVSVPGLVNAEGVPIPLSVELISQNMFDSLDLCHCVESYCDALDSVQNGLVSFSTNQDFQDYIFDQLNCNENYTGNACDSIYTNYVSCVTNFNTNNTVSTPDLGLDENGVQIPLSVELISQNMFDSLDLCHCVESYCAVLDSVQNGLVSFSTNQDFQDYIFDQLNCDENNTGNACDSIYTNYISCVTNFNANYSYYNITPISQATFVAKNYCVCMDAYCNLLNEVLVEQLEFSTVYEFEEFTSIHNACISDSNCFRYHEYINTINYYNTNTTTYQITEIVSEELYNAYDYCNCAKGYGNYIYTTILVNNLQFENQAHFDNYVSLALYCNNENVNDLEKPCNAIYKEYYGFTQDFNLNNTISTPDLGLDANGVPVPLTVGFIPRHIFDSLDLCNCVHNYYSALSAVQNGLVSFTNNQDFQDYVFGQLDCNVKPPCTPAPSSGIVDEMPTVELENDCISVQVNLAVVNAQNQYNQYMDSVRTVHRQKYLDHCLSTQEQLYTSYGDRQHHYTLYYYDNAGNLIKTVPPGGIELLDITSDSDLLNIKINNDRNNGLKTVFTGHRLQTRYEYNSLNQLVAQFTPDTDPMEAFEQTLPNGLHNRLQTNKIQMLNGSLGYLAGQVDSRGYLYKTTDGGETWSRMYNLVASDLKKVVMLDNFNGVAIGEAGTVLKTVDGGNTWDMVITWNTSGMMESLNDIAVLNPTTSPEIMIVGNNGLAVTCTNITSSTPFFSISNSGLSGDVLSVELLNGVFYATAHDPVAGLSRFYQYASNTWTAINDVRNNTFSDLHSYAPNKAYAVDADGRIYANSNISDVATKWVHRSSNLKDPIQQIRFFTEEQGVALVTTNGVKKLYRTIDGAKNWTLLSDSTFSAIAIDKDVSDSMIIAVGENRTMAIIFPYYSGSDQVVVVKTPTTATDFTAVWLEKTGSNTHVIAADDQKIYYTFNALTQNPVWSQTNYSITNSEFVKIEASISGSTIYGVALTASGNAWRLKKETTANIELATSFSGSDYSAITFENNYFYLATTSGTNLQHADFSSSVVLSNSGTLPFASHYLTMRSNNLLVANNTGNIASLVVASGTITSSIDHTNKVVPDKINLLIVDTVGNQLLAFGNDGLAYRFDGTNLFTHLNNSVNENIYDAFFENSEGAIVGQNGLLKRGAIVGNNTLFLMDVLMPSGQSISELINYVDLFGISIPTTNRVYVIGENGTLLYTPNLASGTVNLISQGEIRLNGICKKVGSVNVFIVGENGFIQEQIGATGLLKKEIFIPKLLDVHFRNAYEGTIVAEKFVIRSTSNGIKWNSIRPIGPIIPSVNYSKTWTTNNGKSLLFGNGVTLAYTKSTGLTSIAFPTSNTKAVSKGTDNSNIYMFDNNIVKRVDLNTLNVTSVISLAGSPSDVNAMHVFTNGDFILVGENSLYKHYIDSNNSFATYTTGLPASANFNDIAFKDHLNGIIVGDGGVFYRTNNPQPTTEGYLQTTSWLARNLNGNDPLEVEDANIYTVALGSSVNVLIGGINPTIPSGLLYPYVRKIYDAGGRYSNRFYYDRLGRLVVSRNARQESEKKYSYTQYDALGRVIEAGEKTENDSGTRFKDIFGTMVSGHFNPITIDDGKLNDWISGNGDRKEVTKSYYDEVAILGLPTAMNSDHTTQRHRILHVTYEELYDEDDQTYDHASHYRYDIHGNVKTLLQDNKKMAESFPSVASQQFKRMDYSYDLLSGNVHRMSVQNNDKDQWHHAYIYDADNRIRDVYTNTQSPLTDIDRLTQNKQNELRANSDWQNDAHYYYYDHGPLARVEIGQNNLQGVDYYYNLQGWLKGVNSSVLGKEHDPGMDSDPNEVNALFAKDVFGFGLHYYEDDYKAIGSGSPHAMIQTGSNAANNSSDLYNGNIRFMQTTITNLETREVMPMLNAYKYDQLNRLNESRSYETGLSSNLWDPTTYSEEYFNIFTYDAMGNITTQYRHKRDGSKIDALTYNYHQENGKLLRNRLYQVNDLIVDNVDDTDIDDMGAFDSNPLRINLDNNYSYDSEGRLIKDKQEEIDTIIWRVDGKVKEIRRLAGSEKKNIIFDYNAFGQRIAKHVRNVQTGMLEKSTYYTLDAQGNQLSMYEHYVDESEVKYILAERNIYGSSRLGTSMDFVDMYNPDPIPSYGVTGNRRYELNNHLGNVLMVITDQVYPINDNTDELVDNYAVGLSNSFDYSPFGVQLDGRTMERTIQVCTEVADTVTTYALNETFDSTGNWQLISTSNPMTTITYSLGTMIVTKPSVSKAQPAGDIGASKQFNVGEGLHTVTFDIESNNCEILQLPPASNSPKPIYVHIRDAANNVIAMDSYATTSGSYSIQFTPTSSGTYKIEFLINLAFGCSFSVDNVSISYQEQSSSISCNTGSGNYRYGYQGSEKDDEAKGKGNSYTTHFRLLDPRLGRWLSIDREASSMPWQSPYISMDNSPILLNDVLGDCPDGNCGDKEIVAANNIVSKYYDSNKNRKDISSQIRDAVYELVQSAEGKDMFKTVGDVQDFLGLAQSIWEETSFSDFLGKSTGDKYRNAINSAKSEKEKADIIVERSMQMRSDAFKLSLIEDGIFSWFTGMMGSSMFNATGSFKIIRQGIPKGVSHSVDDIINSASRIQKGNTSRGVQALNKKIGRGDEAYQGVKATKENVDRIIKDVMGAKNRVYSPTRNQQGTEVIDYFNPTTKQGVRLIKETGDFDTFISY